VLYTIRNGTMGLLTCLSINEECWGKCVKKYTHLLQALLPTLDPWIKAPLSWSHVHLTWHKDIFIQHNWLMYFVPQGWMIVSRGIYMLMRMMKAPNRWYIHPTWQQYFHPRRVLGTERWDDDPACVVQCKEISSKCEKISGSLQCLSFQILCCTVGGKKWKNFCCQQGQDSQHTKIWDHTRS
jgi:hypothetical protein